MTRDTAHLSWVMDHMPGLAAQALTKFTELNPNWRGAGWDDCLDVLLDSDSHCDVTERLYEDAWVNDYPVKALPAAVALTLLYASPKFGESTPAEQLLLVMMTITGTRLTGKAKFEGPPSTPPICPGCLAIAEYREVPVAADVIGWSWVTAHNLDCTWMADPDSEPYS